MPFLVGAVAVARRHRACWPPATGCSAAADAGLAGTATPRHATDDVAGEVADEFGGAPGAIDQEVEPELVARRKSAARS